MKKDVHSKVQSKPVSNTKEFKKRLQNRGNELHFLKISVKKQNTVINSATAKKFKIIQNNRHLPTTKT
jgi:hypothetical protein